MGALRRERWLLGAVDDLPERRGTHQPCRVCEAVRWSRAAAAEQGARACFHRGPGINTRSGNMCCVLKMCTHRCVECACACVVHIGRCQECRTCTRTHKKKKK